jgi:hypothetical protein
MFMLMKQKHNNQKKNNNDNRNLSRGEKFAYGCVFARGCSCFNCFYFVLNVFANLYLLLRKGLRVVNVRDIVPKVRDLVLCCAGYSTKGAGFSTWF